MDNYFNNANTKVNVRKYGTKYGKKIEENLIPVKDRGNKKEEKLQALTEAAAKFAENSSKVDSRKLNELKERRLHDKLMQEGYSSLKDNLFKDVMRQICIESLLVDEDVVLENINILNSLVDTEVDGIGGFEGLKNIAKRTKNPLLENMVSVVEDMCQKVAVRVVQEATDVKDLEFALEDDEIKEFDLKKQELGVDTISDFVKDRVLTVVQKEQEASREKGEVMDEIKTKLQDSEADVPVEEAMEVIFKENVEHVSLFESMMRSGYKGLLETSSSAIFESASFDDDFEEDEEYDVKDIELGNVEEIVDEEIDDEEIEKLVVEEGFDIDIAKMFKNHVYAIFEALEKDDTETLEEELEKVSDKSEEIAESCKSKSKATKVKESLRKIQASTEEVIDEACKKTCKEELLICPVCGEDPCVCNDEIIEEGMLKDKINEFFEKRMLKAISKRNFDTVRSNLVKFINNSNSNEELDVLMKDLAIGRKQLNDAKLRYPDAAPKIDEHIKWLNNDYVKLINERRKTLKASQLKESFSKKIDLICESLDNEIDKHENALIKAMESINIDYDGHSICAPMINVKDCNLNNLEFAYKTKAVCESLKCLFTQAESVEDIKQLEEMVDINLNYISKAKDLLIDKNNTEYKTKMLGIAERYLTKLNNNNEVLAESLLIEGVETDCTEAVEQVKDLYQTLATNQLMEGTNDDFMEVVLAEAIVKYTIMESFSTLNIKKYTANEIEQMARKNIQ